MRTAQWRLFLIQNRHSMGSVTHRFWWVSTAQPRRKGPPRAFDEASRRRVPLMALQAWSDVAVLPLLGMDWRTYRDKGAELLGERLAGWQERYRDVQVHRRLVCDVPDHWLIDESKNAQLVVLGSGGRGGYAGMHLGSVTSAVVRSARVPVIVARHAWHEPADHEWIRRVWGWA
jgi:nucleotide-binding universal stress UspA family protein